MRIGLDTRWIRTKNISGIGVLTVELIKWLTRIGRSEDYVIVYENSRMMEFIRPKLELGDGVRIEEVSINHPVLSFRDFVFTWKALNGLKLDVLLTFNQPTFHPFRNYKLVSVVPDLIPITHSYLYTDRKLKTKLFYGMKGTMKYLCNKSDAIIAISQATKRNIVSTLGIDEKMIEVIYPGICEVFHRSNEGEIKSVRKKYGLPERYMLYIGRFDPMKNVDTLIKAYGELPQDLRTDFGLVLAGSHDSKYFPRIKALGSELGLDKYVSYPGYVDDVDLAAFYSSAELFVFPSIAEGFGLPALEAMACSVPVVISGAETLREIAGDHAFKFETLDSHSLASVLRELIENGDKRKGLLGKAADHARGFSWAENARKTLELIKRLNVKD